MKAHTPDLERIQITSNAPHVFEALEVCSLFQSTLLYKVIPCHNIVLQRMPLKKESPTSRILWILQVVDSYLISLESGKEDKCEKDSHAHCTTHFCK